MQKVISLLILCALMSACGARQVQDAEVASSSLPPMRWDHRPEATEWTRATLAALATDGLDLVTLVPTDIGAWCPAYPSAAMGDRQAFWAGLFSALAKHESTWNPSAVGGGGQWFGLVQIAPATASWHGCADVSGSALKDGAANLRCAVTIASAQVPKRGSIRRGMRDWGPFHSSAKRTEMSAWTRAQPYCAGR